MPAGAWRHANGWDNEIADYLLELFRSAGLVDVNSCMQYGVVERRGPEFAERTVLWSEVIENLGGQLATAGLCTEFQLEEARECYDSLVKRHW